MNERADFFEGEHFVDACLFDVEDFPTEREDGLELGFTAAFCGPACGITLDDEDFASIDVTGGAIGEFGGHSTAFEGAFSAGEFSRLSSGFACLCSENAFAADAFGFGRMFFKPGAEEVGDDLSDEWFGIDGEESFLGLIVELGIGVLE